MVAQQPQRRGQWVEQSRAEGRQNVKMGCEPEGRGLRDWGHTESMLDVASATNKNGILQSLFPSSSLKSAKAGSWGPKDTENAVSYLWRHGLRKKEREREREEERRQGGKKERGREAGLSYRELLLCASEKHCISRLSFNPQHFELGTVMTHFKDTDCELREVKCPAKFPWL